MLVNAIQHTAHPYEKVRKMDNNTDDNAADVENLAKKMWGFPHLSGSTRLLIVLVRADYL